MSTSASIASPCVGICTLSGNLCVGCCRTSIDIMNWGSWGKAQRLQALAQRDWALHQSFNKLFELNDETQLWVCWADVVAKHLRPNSAIEGWLQVLQQARTKHLPDAQHCGVSGRFALATTERKKALELWLKHIQTLRAPAA